MNKNIRVEDVLHIDLGTKLGQFKVMPANFGEGKSGFVAFYANCYDVDLHYEMFVVPTDSLHGIAFTDSGEVLWKRRLGIWPSAALYCFTLIDMDQDGRDEIYIVDTTDPEHPLWVEAFVMNRMDVLTGEVTGQWQWPNYGGLERSMWYFRNHIFGGYVAGKPILVSAQGTYADMYLQARNAQMEIIWEKAIPADASGARGSHSFPIVDINNDGIDEVFWGERCLSLADGRELFCIEGDSWHGHSDMIQPIWDRQEERWLLYVNRESHEEIGPRIGMYDAQGNRVWSDVDWGHIHKGWVGRIGQNGELIANGMRITGQTKDATGRYYTGITEFTYNALTGEHYPIPFSLFDTAPVDINGDGRHEILRGVAGGTTELLDRDGALLYTMGGKVAMNTKIMNLPGEQVMVYYTDGVVKVFSDRNAVDSDSSMYRYAHPFYRRNQYARNIENNLCMHGGI